MSVKWTSNHESGILRKSDLKEKKEELFVFGYSCKLFRDDVRALHVDQGKHLIPWMGDETLKIDRYDARGALHDLSTFEAPQGGFDWRVELSRAEQDVEQLCDEERYRALHTDEEEEEMYKEEELKRLHAAGYGQVGFNYDSSTKPEPVEQTAVDVEEPFVPTETFKAMFSSDILMVSNRFLMPAPHSRENLARMRENHENVNVEPMFSASRGFLAFLQDSHPETQKQNAIIEKTAKFIASQGAQMEILIKAKQTGNAQFQFLNRECALHPYYTALIGLVKAGRWPEKDAVPVIEEKPYENEDYLHPSLSTIIESAPSIPSIRYKPSADCDYRLLVSRVRGDASLDEPGAPALAPGEEPPPGTEPLPPAPPPRAPRPHVQIARAPVMYDHAHHVDPARAQYEQNYAAYYSQYMAQAQAQPPAPPAPRVAPVLTPTKSTGLSLMKNYNTDSDSEGSDEDDAPTSETQPAAPTPAPAPAPPEDIRVVIDKMAAYVARNGDDFAEIVRAKRDPRFAFLEPGHAHHAYYARLMRLKRGGDVNGGEASGQNKTGSAPVSFSIKKLKEPDPILPKPALPYESSSDEDSENKQEKTEKTDEQTEPPKTNVMLACPDTNIPPVIVYKIEPPVFNNVNFPTLKAAVNKPTVSSLPEPMVVQQETPLPINVKIAEEKPVESLEKEIPTIKDDAEKVPEKSATLEKRSEKDRIREDKIRERDTPRKREKRKRHDKKDYRSEKRESRRSARRSVERERKKDRESEKDRDKKRRKVSKEETENEVISLVDMSDDLIDLTEDHSDCKVEADVVGEAAGAESGAPSKQLERRRRAAEFLRAAGVAPAAAAAAALPATSLASAMVDTLESIRKKKEEEEERRRRREKRRQRSRHGHDDNGERSHHKSKRRKYKSSDDDESDYDSSKKKKRNKKDKKHSSTKSKKKKRPETEVEVEENHQLPLNIDLTNTLKELRSASPTKDLVLNDIEETQPSVAAKRDSSSEEELARRERTKKKNREYSEGEWSSDSEGDSYTSGSRRD